MSACEIRVIQESDRSWVTDFFITHWSSPQMVYSKGIHQCDQLPGFAAFDGSEPIGLVTFEMKGDECEVISLDSLQEGKGVGSALLEAVELAAKRAGCRRVWLITTNDNLDALRFYQKRGYEMVQIFRRAVDLARKIKPQIPQIGYYGITISDEIELEKGL